MSDGTVVGCSMQSDDRWILHGEGQQPGKNTLGACSSIIALFKRFRAIIDRYPDIGIASKICNTAFAFEKFRMKLRANGNVFGKFFRMSNGANELQPYFSPVFELAQVKHIETDNTYEATSRRRFDIGLYLPSEKRISRLSGQK